MHRKLIHCTISFHSPSNTPIQQRIGYTTHWSTSILGTHSRPFDQAYGPKNRGQRPPVKRIIQQRQLRNLAVLNYHNSTASSTLYSPTLVLRSSVRYAPTPSLVPISSAKVRMYVPDDTLHRTSSSGQLYLRTSIS